MTGEWKLIIGVASLAVVILAILAYGDSRYKDGVKETVAEYEAADKQGAKTVNETSRKILDSIGDDTDPDSLLSETGGLRDD